MNLGYVKLFRNVTEKSVWGDPKKLRLWIYCLMRASYKEKEIIVGNQVIKLQTGQFVTGRESLAKEYNRDLQEKDSVSDKTLWRWLKVLETNELVSIKSTNKYSIITVSGDSFEQDFEHQLIQKDASVVHQTSTNKNVKNYKKNNNSTSLEDTYKLLNSFVGGE